MPNVQELRDKVEGPRRPRADSAGAPAGRTAQEDVKAALTRIAALSGVSLAMLVDREGYLIESAGDPVVDEELAGALTASLAAAAREIGRELGQGGWVSAIAECDGGLILVHRAGPTAMLGALLREPALLGKVRYHVKQAVSDVLGLL